MMGRLRSYLLLGLELVLQLLRWPFRPRHGYRLLITRFAPDRLLPLSKQDLEWIRLLARCDGCGLCDAGCAASGRLVADRLPPSRLILSCSRSLVELTQARGDLAQFSGCAECGACSGWCPRDIPVDRVPTWAVDLLRRLDEAGFDPWAEEG